MSKTSTAMVCTHCGHRALQWSGRCTTCGEWGTLEERKEAPRLAVGEPATFSFADISGAPLVRWTTGIGELDRVLGGGLVPGTSTLIAGEPGIGKSTLMLQAAAGLEAAGRSVLVASGEEAVAQVAARGHRVASLKTTRLSDASSVPDLIALVRGVDVAIVDSVQSLRDPELPGEPGSVSQVRGCAASIAAAARDSSTALFLVGHVTKDGSVAGPRSLEHLVDVVLAFEGEKTQSLRSIRGIKNRFGPTEEIGLFEMHPGGLREVPDASGMFLSERRAGIPGSAVGCAIEGRRPVALDVQTLVVGNPGGVARRVAQGIEQSRLGVAIAVLDRRAGVSLASYDVYASIAGGYRTNDRGLDLALSLALAAARRDVVVPSDVAAVGEVGLGGEIRGVPAVQARIKELARLGFEKIIAPANSESQAGIEVVRVESLRQAISFVF